MQIPKRRSEMLRRASGKDESNYITAAAYRRIENTVRDLQEQRPRAVEDLSRAREMGDLSENAAYTEAKGRLGRIDGRILGLKERLKRAIIIQPGADSSGRVRIGSTATVTVGGKEKKYEILGSLETDPARGRVSHLSPLGAALLGHGAGESVTVKANGKEIVYRIINVE